MAKNESTLFYFEEIEHIVNKLSNNFTGMDKETYKEEKVAQYYLGMIYLNGYGVEKNTEKGIEYIIKSAKRKCKQAIDYIIKENY